MAELYNVTVLAVRPGTHPQALSILGTRLAGDADLLACWYAEIGMVNRIMLIRKSAEPAAATIAARHDALRADNPFGLHEYLTGVTMDTYASFDFMPPLRPGDFGPCYEVRNYVLKPDALAPTQALWRQAVPARAKISPVLAGMSAVTGDANRFLHIWPYKTFDERARLRERAMAEGVWPPPGGPSHLVSQQVDIYLPAPFSPMK